MEADGTATTTTSASEPSPPSRPRVLTVWPARSQRAARPPPTLPRPMTVMFTDGSRCCPRATRTRSRSPRTRPPAPATCSGRAPCRRVHGVCFLVVDRLAYEDHALAEDARLDVERALTSCVLLNVHRDHRHSSALLVFLSIRPGLPVASGRP